ncbi:hypothetical protein IAT38_004911 [Cryptococcus sp. DSM 104549]
MPYLARLGDRVSHLLHSFVYSFPSNSSSPFHPSAQRPALAPPTPAPVYSTASAGGAVSVMEALDEPGEGGLADGLGPLSFLGSGYGITLILTALLLNRIHHIVRRPRQPPPPAPAPPLTAYQRFRASLALILTDPSTPQYLRLPGLAALLRAWVLFTVLLLQVANLWPDKVPADGAGAGGGVWRGVVLGVGKWAGEMEMERVCWQVLLSVCVGLICGGLATGLDPVRRRDPGAGFNLFGYSFLLHLYSSPLTHRHPASGSSPGRPDVHALFQLWLSLGELTWLQAIEMSPRWRRNLLLPTGVCGVLGLVHFVYVITTVSLRFPSFTFLTHLLALFLSIVIIFTVVLRAITLLFTQGYIPSLVSLLPHEGVVPSVEDDFGVAILKVGTACIEATHHAGLRNELASLQEHKSPWLEIGSTSSQVHRGVLAGVPTPGFSTEITDIEVSELADGVDESSSFWREFRKLLRACLVTIVFCTMWLVMATPVGRKVVYWSRKAWRSRWWYGPRGWRVWRRDVWAEPPEARARRLIAHMTQLDQENKRLVRRQQKEKEKARAKAKEVRAKEARARQGEPMVPHRRQYRSGSTPFPERGGSPEAEASNTTLAVTFGQYLLGNDDLEIEEEDDGEWKEYESDGSSVSGTGEYEDDDDEYEDEHGFQHGHEHENDHGHPHLSEPAAMYHDLMISELEDDDPAAVASGLPPVILAHLTSNMSFPLTRRRYNSLIAGASAGAGQSLEDASPGGQSSAVLLRRLLEERRAAMSETVLNEDDEETRRTCVVCLVQQRDTVLWPCRCLAMCNDCRESLASRLSASQHMCPCCRRKVEGYSRIYIP